MNEILTEGLGKELLPFIIKAGIQQVDYMLLCLFNFEYVLTKAISLETPGSQYMAH